MAKRIAIGKYVTNLGVLGAVAGAVGTARRTGSMPNDWRRLLVWGVWIMGVVLAIAGVAMQEQENDSA